MKMKHTLIFIISLMIMMLVPLTSFSQNEAVQKDTLVYKQKYGLRLGADLSKIGRTFFDENYTGFEINADYRLTKNIYLAGINTMSSVNVQL